MQRTWQDPDLSRFLSSEHRPPNRRQIPGIATALDRHLPMVADQRLPPIATTFDSHTPRPQDHSASPELGNISTSRPSSPFRSSEARVEKRPRWHWSQDTTPIVSAQTDPLAYVSYLTYCFGQSVAKVMTFHDANGCSLQKQEDRSRESGQITWSRPDHPHLGSQQEIACSNCANTDDLVSRVVSGLLSLEQDIRYALALSKRDQTVRHCLKLPKSQSQAYVLSRTRAARLQDSASDSLSCGRARIY
jgi:hypothetical protein